MRGAWSQSRSDRGTHMITHVLQFEMWRQERLVQSITEDLPLYEESGGQGEGNQVHMVNKRFASPKESYPGSRQVLCIRVRKGL